MDRSNIRAKNRNCKQRNQPTLRNFYQTLTPFIAEINMVQSSIVPCNTSYAGVLRKGKNVTVLGDSMISGIKRREFNGSTKENVIFKTFRGAASKDMLSYAQPRSNQ